jgi:hypothetical protein
MTTRHTLRSFIATILLSLFIGLGMIGCEPRHDWEHEGEVYPHSHVEAPQVDWKVNGEGAETLLTAESVAGMIGIGCSSDGVSIGLIHAGTRMEKGIAYLRSYRHGELYFNSGEIHLARDPQTEPRASKLGLPGSGPVLDEVLRILAKSEKVMVTGMTSPFANQIEFEYEVPTKGLLLVIEELPCYRGETS